MQYEKIIDLSILEECGSVNAAAKKMFMTPSGLSKKIKALEDEFGVTLFERDCKGCKLNENGKLVLEYSRKINELIDECKRKINGEDILKIRVGFSFLHDRSLFYRIQEKSKSLDEKIELIPVPLDDVFYNGSIKDMLSIINSKVDIILDIKGNSYSEIYTALPFAENKICFLVPKGHKLYNKQSIKTEDISDLKILKLEDGIYDSADDVIDFIKKRCKNIEFEQLDDSYADIGTHCRENNLIFLCLDSYKSIEPYEKIIPLDFTNPIPFCIFYRNDSKPDLIKAVHNIYNSIIY